jgi:phosphotriesterase-related protein
MTAAVPQGEIRTVTGPVRPETLGPTLVHEHLLIDFRCRYRPGAQEVTAPGGRLDPADRWRLVLDPAAHESNLVRTELAQAEAELRDLLAAGGRAVVDVTCEGLGRDLPGLRTLSERTGVLIVGSAGFYVHASHPDWLHEADVHRIADHLTADVLGAGPDGIACGFIGEIGVDAFLDCELRVVLAAAVAQARTGATVAIHTASGVLHDQRAPTLELVRRFIDAGGDPSRLVLCHQDGSGDDPAHQDRLLELGAVLSYDTFGFETCFRRGRAYVQLPSDTRRIAELRSLWDRGWGEQVVLSQDVCYRSMTRRWGGWGIAHLLGTLPPRFAAAGLGTAELATMLTATPARLLTLTGS